MLQYLLLKAENTGCTNVALGDTVGLQVLRTLSQAHQIYNHEHKSTVTSVNFPSDFLLLKKAFVTRDLKLSTLLRSSSR